MLAYLAENQQPEVCKNLQKKVMCLAALGHAPHNIARLCRNSLPMQRMEPYPTIFDASMRA